MTRLESALDRLAAVRKDMTGAAFRHHGMRARFQAIKDRAPVADRVITSDNLFPTPPHIAWEMAELLELSHGMRVLEPSCGTGRLLEALYPRVVTFGLVVSALDICPELASYCGKLHPWAQVSSGDFMTHNGRYDRIVMNPPFRRGLDIQHIMHAYSLLAPRGLLVALCYDGAKQNTTLPKLAETWKPLPPKTFRTEGTDAPVVLITMRNQ